jgi:hypothetical protein
MRLHRNIGNDLGQIKVEERTLAKSFASPPLALILNEAQA